MSKYALTDIISDLFGVPISERSQNAVVRCPFHDDRLPSLSIDLERGLWLCFGCPERGTIQYLAARLNKEIDNVTITLRSYEASANNPYFEEAHDFAELARGLRANLVSDKPRAVIDYITSKSIHPRAVRHFQLGWDRERSVIAFPFYDEERVFGIRYRGKDGRKFAEKGTRRGIYNLNEVRQRPYVILCEGESDTLSMWSHLTAITRDTTIENTIGVGGVPGAGVSAGQWEVWATDLMWANRVFVAFDADEAGNLGASTVMKVIGDKGVRITPNQGKDFAEHFKNGGTLLEYGELGECFAQHAATA